MDGTLTLVGVVRHHQIIIHIQKKKSKYLFLREIIHVINKPFMNLAEQKQSRFGYSDLFYGQDKQPELTRKRTPNNVKSKALGIFLLGVTVHHLSLV